MSASEIVGIVIACLSIIGAIAGGAIFVVKAFIKQSEKTTNAFEESVNIHKDYTIKNADLHKEYSDKIIDLTQKVIQTNERGITAINSNNAVVSNNTKSLDKLSDSVDLLQKYTQDLAMNSLLELRETKKKEK